MGIPFFPRSSTFAPDTGWQVLLERRRNVSALDDEMRRHLLSCADCQTVFDAYEDLRLMVVDAGTAKHIVVLATSALTNGQVSSLYQVNS